MPRSPELPRKAMMTDVIKEMRAPRTETDSGWVIVGNFIDIGDPGNDPGTDELSPPFLNGWTNTSGFTTAFRLNEIGKIEISASVKDGTVGDPVFVLPEDYRRSYEFAILQATSVARTICKIVVRANGEVVVEEIIEIP